jgi:hypothetical protein
MILAPRPSRLRPPTRLGHRALPRSPTLIAVHSLCYIVCVWCGEEGLVPASFGCLFSFKTPTSSQARTYESPQDIYEPESKAT